MDSVKRSSSVAAWTSGAGTKGGGNTDSVKRSSAVDSAVKETDSARCLSSVAAMISSKRASIRSKISPNRESIRSKISRKLNSILGLGLGWEKI
jgi:hypothetical protein